MCCVLIVLTGYYDLLHILTQGVQFNLTNHQTIKTQHIFSFFPNLSFSFLLLLLFLFFLKPLFIISYFPIFLLLPSIFSNPFFLFHKFHLNVRIYFPPPRGKAVSQLAPRLNGSQIIIHFHFYPHFLHIILIQKTYNIPINRISLLACVFSCESASQKKHARQKKKNT